MPNFVYIFVFVFRFFSYAPTQQKGEIWGATGRDPGLPIFPPLCLSVLTLARGWIRPWPDPTGSSGHYVAACNVAWVSAPKLAPGVGQVPTHLMCFPPRWASGASFPPRWATGREREKESERQTDFGRQKTQKEAKTKMAVVRPATRSKKNQ